MKEQLFVLKVLSLAVFLLTGSTLSRAANPKTTIGQVTAPTTLSTSTDYIISSATPFGPNGVVNITNTDRAVLILAAVKPSKAIPMLADHVQINGATAVNGQNCQVKLYNHGAIILPYGDGTKPLTVYSGVSFTGTAVNDFGLENSGGFMNTLSESKLNNKIRSFKLKRGYMVTFSLRPGGYGYSRCFIAADQDLEISSLPDILDRKISSYRIFKWNDTGKQQLAAADGDYNACNALNVTSTYGWGVGSNMGPDIECVPHHIKESWPSASALGAATWSPHMKTNNEPRNPSDEESCGLDAILANWEALMATGMRLCSPSSWDGSDYWNGTGFLKEFFDSIDVRGWRCDIIDLHGYWLLSNFQTNVPNWYNAVKRPVWISEWVWGASWSGGSGAFVSGVTEAQNRNNVEAICKYLNGLGYVERFFYWNAERDPSKVYKNGKLTSAGEYYAALNTGVGYTGNYDYIPKAPTVSAPKNLKVSYNEATAKATVTFNESYGSDLSVTMTLERRTGSSASWQSVNTFTLQENPAAYSYQDASAAMGCQYRVHVKDYTGRDLYSSVESITKEEVVYLYNIGAQQWLTAGNDWGTKASLTPYGGIDVTMSTAGDGKYTIETGMMNSGDKHYLRKDGTSVWVDQPVGEWTLTPSGTVGGKPVYLMTIDGSNLAYDGSSSALTLSSSTGTAAQWQLQSRNDRLAQLSQASMTSPVDATFLLEGPNFHCYDRRNGAWQDNPTVGGAQTNYCAEKYDKTFDVCQVTTAALPAGRYRLMVQGFYRNGGYADAASKRNDGRESLEAMLYAGSAKVPLQSIFIEAGKLPSVGKNTNGISGKFPDTMSDASAYFTAGLYENDMQFVQTTASNVRIGISKQQSVGSDWTIFDNFRLLYLGDFTTATVTARSADGHHWATFYSSAANYELPSGAIAYTATVRDTELLLHELGSVVPKGCAVIIVSGTAGQLTLTSTSATATVADAQALIKANVLKGNDSDMAATVVGSGIYVMGTVSGKFGFHPYSGLALPAERAYLLLPAAARSLSVGFADSETTALPAVSSQQPQPLPLFDMKGQRVVNPRQRSIIIRQGNKLFNK